MERQNDVISSDSISEDNSQWINKDKTEILEQTGYGTLVAFFDSKGKARSGAICGNDIEHKVIIVVTEFGWEFKVPYGKVLWVKNGTRWPKGVYKLLKERKNQNVKKSDNEEN